MSYVKDPLPDSGYASAKKKSRAKQVNIDELLKIYNQASQNSTNYLTFKGPPPISIPHFTLTGRHRTLNKNDSDEKRALSSHFDEKRSNSKINTSTNVNEINRALSQVLIDFKEFKSDQQVCYFYDKRERFKSNKTNFNDLSNNVRFLGKSNIKLNECDFISTEINESNYFKQKPPPHERSRGILKELNLGKRAVSMPENQQLKISPADFNNKENKIFPLPILKSSAHFNKSKGDGAKSQKIKNLTFKEENLAEKDEKSLSSEATRFKSNLNATSNIQSKAESKENHLGMKRPKSLMLQHETNEKNQTNRGDITRIYSNLINNINQNLLNTPKAKAQFRVSLKDSPKKNLNVNLNRAQSFKIDHNSRNKNETTTRTHSYESNGLFSREKSLCVSKKNNEITDLFNFYEPNQIQNEFYSSQTNDNIEGCSQIEKLVVNSIDHPIATTEKEQIEVFGQRGILLNKSEELAWKGERPLSDYPLNLDLNQNVIIKKQPQEQIKYIQSLAIRYLKPPTPQVPDILIKQEADVVTNSAPPIIIRQQPESLKPETPEPLIIREAPPPFPPKFAQKDIKITLKGRKLSPPPRKVIIEKFSELPSKPCPILIERWLPYTQIKRKVLFKPLSSDLNKEESKKDIQNLIIEWEPPNVCIKKEFKYLGISQADPDEYIKNFGSSLKEKNDLPGFAQNLKLSDDEFSIGVVSQSESTGLYETISNTNTLDQIKTKSFQLKAKQEELNNKKITSEFENYSRKLDIPELLDQSSSLEIAAAQVIQASQTFSSCTSSPAVKLAFNSASFVALNDIMSQIFEKIAINGQMSFEEVKRVFVRLNYNLNRKFEESEIDDFFVFLSKKNRNSMNLDEFKTLFFKLST